MAELYTRLAGTCVSNNKYNAKISYDCSEDINNKKSSNAFNGHE